MKQTVYIYDKDPAAVTFLERFFSAHKGYDATFFKSITTLKKTVLHAPPDFYVAGAPDCLERISSFTDGTPVIATMTRELSHCMRSIIDNNVEHYLIPPFQDCDLDCKLELALKRAHYVESLLQQKEDLEVISALTDLLASTLDPEEVLYLIVKKLSEVIPVSRCSILSVEPNATEEADVISTFENRHIDHLKLDLKKYPEIRKALKTKKTVIVRNAERDPVMRSVRESIAPLGIKSILVIPVMFRSEVIGTLYLRTSTKDHVFTDREIRLCRDIARASAKALNTAYLFEEVSARSRELEKLAITDFLTGLYNIRYLYHRLESEFSRTVRYNVNLSCIMLDIDYFKNINDFFGHRIGDLVLREFASLILGHSRLSDVVARYGGEEFIILLPQTTIKGAQNKAEDLRRIIEAHRFEALPADTVITASLGVACYPHPKIKTQDALITLADDALIKAKLAGRNRVIVYS